MIRLGSRITIKPTSRFGRNQKKVLRYLKRDIPTSTRALVALTELDLELVRIALRRLLKRGTIVRDYAKHYDINAHSQLIVWFLK